MVRATRSISRVDRALVAVAVAATVLSVPARANPWHLIVVEDGVAPGLVALGAGALAVLAVRLAVRMDRLDPAAHEGRLPPLAVAVAPYPLLLFGLVALPVLAWPSAVDAAAVVGRSEVPDASFAIEGTDLVVDVEHADCFLRIDGTVTVEAHRGVRSRRVELHRDRDCVEIELSFLEEGTTVQVRAACTLETFDIDPGSLDVRDRATEQLGPDDCVDGRALQPGPMVLPPP